MVRKERARSWSFTWNDPDPNDYQTILGLETRYCVFWKEVGELGTPQYKGTLCFNSLKSVKVLKRALPECEFEKCFDLEASVKASKRPEGRLEGPWETGCKFSQGARNDLIKKIAANPAKHVPGIRSELFIRHDIAKTRENVDQGLAESPAFDEQNEEEKSEPIYATPKGKERAAPGIQRAPLAHSVGLRNEKKGATEDEERDEPKYTIPTSTERVMGNHVSQRLFEEMMKKMDAVLEKVDAVFSKYNN